MKKKEEEPLSEKEDQEEKAAEEVRRRNQVPGGLVSVKDTEGSFISTLEIEEKGRRLKLSFSNPSPSSISQHGTPSGASSASDFPSESLQRKEEDSLRSLRSSMKNEELKEEEESQKGRSVSHRHVASSSNDALGSVAAALGMENVVQGPAVPAGMDPHAGDLVGGVRPPIYITPWGERYHTSSECSSLRRTRRLIRSSYCPECAGDVTLDGGIQVFAVGPGSMAHYDRNCPRGSGARGYLRCGLCRNRG